MPNITSTMLVRNALIGNSKQAGSETMSAAMVKSLQGGFIASGKHRNSRTPTSTFLAHPERARTDRWEERGGKYWGYEAKWNPRKPRNGA